MNLIPFGFGDKKTAIAKTEKTEIATTEEDGDVVVIRKSNGISISSKRNAIVQVRAKAIKIGDKVYNIDPQQLIRMIKQVTQTIGEYKNRDNPYAGYVIGALRKARSDMVSDLEHHFNIHWEIDEEGKCVFFM